jgi:TPR repeat protein
VKDIQPMAEQGDANAQFFLGTMYRNGQNVPQDYAQAIAWYRKSAEKGDLRAQYNLGMMYRKGQGVPENNTEAARWFESAAQRGHVPSQYNLGVLYGNGKGVPLDIVEAHKWFSIAALSGDAEAVRDRDLTGQILTPTQLEESQKLTRAWLDAHPQTK